MRRLKGKKKKGFTLIEIIAVIAIIGILATMIVPNISGFSTKAKVSKAFSDAKIMVNAVDAYNAEQDGSASTAIVDTILVTSTALGAVVGADKTVKSLPTEFPATLSVADLRLVADKTKYDQTGTTSGTWSVDKDGKVVIKQ